MPDTQPSANLRNRLWTIIFGTDTTAGRGFDIVLLILILASVLNVMLISVAAINDRFGATLNTLEWFFTFVFSVEYVTRIYAARRRWAYITSFYGLIDLVSILPLYLTLVLPSAHYFIAVRTLRLMRIFRVLKLVRYANDANVMTRSLRHAQRKMQIFLGVLSLFTVILGALMYVVEGPAHGFTSIPRSMYWAIVTISTVGYGDIAPGTPLGQALAGLAIMLGYALLAVTAGIITAELTKEIVHQRRDQQCPHCEKSGHEIDANYCKFCGGNLDEDDTQDPPADEDQAAERDKLD